MQMERSGTSQLVQPSQLWEEEGTKCRTPVPAWNPGHERAPLPLPAAQGKLVSKRTVRLYCH